MLFYHVKTAKTFLSTQFRFNFCPAYTNMCSESDSRITNIHKRIEFVLEKFHISSTSTNEEIFNLYKKLTGANTPLSVSALAYATWQGLALTGLHKDPKTIAKYYNVSTKRMLKKAKQTSYQSVWHSAADSAIFLGDYVGMPYRFSKLAKDIMELLELQIIDKTPEVLFAAIAERYLRPLMHGSATVRERLRGVILEIDTKEICKKIGIQWRHVFKVASTLPDLHITKKINQYVLDINKNT